MIHYHYYIEAGAQLDENTRIYKVGVGSSKQGRRDYLFLTAFAVEHGHYFEMVSDKTDDFVRRVTLSLGGVLPSIKVLPAREMVRYLKGAGLPTLSNNALLSADSQRKVLNINYRIISNLRRRDSHC